MNWGLMLTLWPVKSAAACLIKLVTLEEIVKPVEMAGRRDTAP